jgi:hypothetical protein
VPVATDSDEDVLEANVSGKVAPPASLQPDQILLHDDEFEVYLDGLIELELQAVSHVDDPDPELFTYSLALLTKFRAGHFNLTQMLVGACQIPVWLHCLVGAPELDEVNPAIHIPDALSTESEEPVRGHVA